MKIIKLSELTSTVLTWSAQLAYIKEFHKYYASYGLCLLTDIGFPLIKTFKSEKIEMRENPSEFVKQALDVWDRQKFFWVKSQAAKFIETIADKIPEMFTSICDLWLDLLVFAITKDPNMENYPTLNHHDRISKFYLALSDEDLIDISLIVLTMVSYALPKRDELKNRFIEICEKVTKPIMERESLLLNWRLTILLGYYIDILYKNNENIFYEVISLLINSLNWDKANMALAFQSADTLNTIINDNDIIPRVSPYINEILERLYEHIMVVWIPDFFDFLSEIFKYYSWHINQKTLINWVKWIVQRIEIDVQASNGSPKEKNPFKQTESKGSSENGLAKSSIVISKCWSIVFTILETPEFVNDHLLEIEEELKYLFGLLSDPFRIEFDDDILKAMRIIINNSNRLSKTMEILLPYLSNSFNKHKFVFSELYELIRAYIKVSKNVILSSQEHVSNIFDYGVQTIYNEDHCANGAVYLIQLFLMLKGEDTNPYLNSIVPEVIQKVVTKIQDKNINKIHKRILYEVILSSMISCYEATIDTLEKLQLTETVINYFIKLSMKKVTNLQERKLISVSLTNLLTQEKLPDQIRDQSSTIISKIIDILVKTSINEAKKAKKRDMKKIQLNEADERSLDSEDEYNESSSDGESDKENYYNYAPRPAALGVNEDGSDVNDYDDNSSADSQGSWIIESEIDIETSFALFKTGFNTFDEFDYFKKVISSLYQNHAPQMDQLISQLSEPIQKALKGLILVQKVDIGRNVVHRKVVKAVRSSIRK